MSRAQCAGRSVCKRGKRKLQRHVVAPPERHEDARLLSAAGSRRSRTLLAMQWAQRACLASALPVAAALVFWAARRRRRQLGQWQPGQPLADDDWLSPQVTVGSGVNQKSYCHTRPPPIAEPVGPLLSTEPLVVVVGLGGVGSHAAHLLLRGGVRRLRLVDFDQVSLSSLNRHATAVRRDVGTPKARALRDQLLRIAPDAQAPRRPCRAHVLRMRD